MVYCTYCGHQFTRDEHLERHILTHTNVKPFKCFTCHMSFARRDLLQRHYTVHGRDQNQDPLPASNGMIPKSAGRTPIACSNCAKTKTKCDKKFPCTRCSGRNLKCTLRPTRRATKNISRSGIYTEATAGLDPDTSTQSLDGCVQQPAVTSIPIVDPSNEHSVSPQQTVPIRPTGSETTMVPMSEALQDFSIVDGSPSGSANRHTPATSSTTTAYSPSAQTPGYIQPTTYSATFDGANSMGKADDVTSPRFMLDWGQIAMPITYEGILGPQTVMNGDFNFDPRSIAMGPADDAMFGLLPGGGLPGETPLMDNLFSEMAIGEAGISMMPQRNHSMPSNASSLIDTHSGEISAVVAAQDSWPAFRCMPIIPSSSCPRTAKLNLERLEQTLRDQQGWSTWSPTEFEKDDHLTVMRLHDSTRDKLLAITQTFLHKALEIHRNRDSSLFSTGGSSSASNFVLLPPTLVLEYFLRSYANCFETYFPVTSKGTLDVNELMHCYNDRAASLLVLMMIAQGAMNISSTEARMLTGGLTEACRISLFDLIEKDITMAGDHNVLHAAMLFTVQAAWSGDKWQMDIAMGQRGMYLAMLRNSNLLENQLSAVNTSNQRQNTDLLWGEWILSEARSRLVYSWAMADQDIALFHDTPPLFSITEFKVPMPDADRLWHAKSAVEWSENFEQVHEFSGGFSSIGSGARPLPLKDLFCHFLDNEMIHLGIEMTPLQLRLLLHPLQALVCHSSLLLSSFSDPLAARQNDASRMVTAASTRHRLEEVRSLLKRWFDLAERYLKANSMCIIMQTNLVIYHLISLNAVTNFPEIERLARRETFDGSYEQLTWLHKRCLLDVEEAILHCGQVLRLVRSMPRGRRPPWWAGAIYRAVLILWTDSLLRKDTSSPSMSSTSSSGKSSISGTGMFRVPGPSFAIDALHSDHPLIIRYLTKREGVPYVTKRDGSLMPIDRAYAVLQYGVEVIDEGAATRFSDGIRAKLDRLAQG